MCVRTDSQVEHGLRGSQLARLSIHRRRPRLVHGGAAAVVVRVADLEQRLDVPLIRSVLMQTEGALEAVALAVRLATLQQIPAKVRGLGGFKALRLYNF